jgi:hypothetical protein
VTVNAGTAALPAAASYSRLSALALHTTSGLFIQVFYQDTTNKLRIAHWLESEGWAQGSTELPVAMAGTSLSANVVVDAQGGYLQERLFFQGPGTADRVYTQTINAPWALGKFLLAPSNLLFNVNKCLF